MKKGMITRFNENTGYGYVKILEDVAYLDYKEMWFRYLDVQGATVRRGDNVHVWIKARMGVDEVVRLEKI